STPRRSPRRGELLTAPRAGNGTRTRDPNLGKVVLYQLSYSRVWRTPILASGGRRRKGRSALPRSRWKNVRSAAPVPDAAANRPGSGGEGDRTPDLVNAIHALSQLSYAPIIIARPG